jgi:hypothetical protein
VSPGGQFPEVGSPYSPFRLFVAAPLPWALVGSNLSPCSKVLYSRLALFSGEDGACFPGLATIARSMSWSERKALRQLSKLKSGGFLERWQPGWNRSAHCAFIWQEILAGSLLHPDPSLQVGCRYNPYRRFKCIFVPLPLLSCGSLCSGAKLLFGVLGSHAGGECLCFPSFPALARETATSKRTVSRWMDDLVAHALIRRFREPHHTNSTSIFIWNDMLASGVRRDRPSGPSSHSQSGSGHSDPCSVEMRKALIDTVGDLRE